MSFFDFRMFPPVKFLSAVLHHVSLYYIDWWCSWTSTCHSWCHCYRLVTGVMRCEHISTVLWQPHWLSVHSVSCSSWLILSTSHYTAYLHSSWPTTVKLLLRPAVDNCDCQTLLGGVSFLIAPLVSLIRHFLSLDHVCETLLFDLCWSDFTELQFDWVIKTCLFDWLRLWDSSV